jgi:Methyltransferase domain
MPEATGIAIGWSNMGRQARAIKQALRTVRDSVLSRAAQDASLHGPLRVLLDREGSDKGQWYGGLYEMLLEPMRGSVSCLIEIGIGTMVPNAPSSMVDWGGKGYRPGASLRAWRDYFAAADIHGIDPAPDTEVMNEARITTHQFDSRDATRVAELFARFPSMIPDVIIDDGLHTAEAQIATMENFLPRVRPGGLYVVEDVEPKDVRAVAAQIDRIRPNSIYVPDMRPEPWIAIAIRTPLG